MTENKMIGAGILTTVVLLMTGCFRSPEKGLNRTIPSPSGSYQISASVNKDESDKTRYLCLKLRLTDSRGTELDVVQTSVSYTMKWALGWMKEKDTVVLYSSDIGTCGYEIAKDGKLKEIETDKVVIDRARELYEEKYK
ncbi:MAG: hypothetical protein ACYS21_16745 [Planctomycetota bacterium]|jgi:hypothetical protein